MEVFLETNLKITAQSLTQHFHQRAHSMHLHSSSKVCFLTLVRLHSITTVGATYLIPEVAADFSGGGFSNYFPRPDYQSEVVSAYLALLGNNDTGLYNASGRAYPDVSAYGVNCSVVIGGVTQVVSGTSCSAPIFASTIAILNDRLLAAGKPTLGFLNPWLYSGAGAAAFTDIVSGNNTSCGDDDNLGFFATKGWDPVRF